MQMDRRVFLGALGAMAVPAFVRANETTAAPAAGVAMAQAAKAFLATLSPEERGKATFSFDDPERQKWHFFPMVRKGLTIHTMDGGSEVAAYELLRASLTPEGYEQARRVMAMEEVLFLYEAGDVEKRSARRDPLGYYVSIFGEPSPTGRWGWRCEGHHLSLNFVIDGGKIVGSTPEFFGINPATMESAPGRIVRVLGAEEDLGRKVYTGASPDEQKTMLVSATPPNDVQGPGEAHPVLDAPAGLVWSQMSSSTQAAVRAVLDEYLKNMHAEVKAGRLAAIESAGWDKVHFAWWGSDQRYQPHHYRIQGPTFVVEYNNIQDGANHIHSMWRNVQGDFALARA